MVEEKCQIDIDIDFNNVCRACLLPNFILKNIFIFDVIDGNILSFDKIYEHFTNTKITKSDGSPQNICISCKKIIIDSYVLKKKCMQSNNLIRKILNLPKLSDIQTLPISTSPEPEPEPTTLPSPQPTSSEEETVLLSDKLKKTANEEFSEVIPVTSENGDKKLPIEQIYVDDDNRKKVDLINSIEEIENNEFDYEEIDILDEIEEEEEEAEQEVYNINFDLNKYEADDAVDITQDIYDKNIIDNVDVKNSGKIQTNNSDTHSHLKIEYNIKNEMVDVATYYDVIYDDNDDKSENEEITILDENLSIISFDTLPKEQQKEKQCEQYKEQRPKSKQQTSNSNKLNEVYCDYCDTYVSKVKQDYHNRMHNEIFLQILNCSNFYRCGNCNIIYTELEKFQQHMYALKNNNVCQKIIDNNTSGDSSAATVAAANIKHINQSLIEMYTMHLKLYSITKISDKLLKCDYCNNNFITDNDYNINEIKTHFDDNHFKVNEMKCIQYANGKIMDDNEYVDDVDDDDMTAVDDRAEPNYNSSFSNTHTCSVCYLEFNNLITVVHHIYFHLDIYHCPILTCGQYYKKFKQLCRHIEIQHTLINQHICNYCNYEFQSHLDLKIHMRKECKQRNIHCTMCDKTFFKIASYNIHKRIHTKGKSYECDNCQKSFVQRGDFITHYRIHTNSKPYICSICGVGFRSPGNRIDHMSTHESERKYKCEICKKYFISERTLRSHLLIHTGIKRFQCNTCFKEFYRNYHLKLHLKTHSKIKN